jgi:hypothetical protein
MNDEMQLKLEKNFIRNVAVQVIREMRFQCIELSAHFLEIPTRMFWVSELACWEALFSIWNDYDSERYVGWGILPWLKQFESQFWVE